MSETVEKNDVSLACPKLTKDPNNVKLFCEIYESRALSKFGSAGKILKARKELVFNETTLDLSQAATKSERTRLSNKHREEERELKELKKSYNENKIKLFGDLKLHI